MDMAHQKSKMGERFDSKGLKLMDVVYASFKKVLEKKYGPQKTKGVCKDNSRLQNLNSPVFG